LRGEKENNSALTSDNKSVVSDEGGSEDEDVLIVTFAARVGKCVRRGRIPNNSILPEATLTGLRNRLSSKSPDASMKATSPYNYVPEAETHRERVV
jgi:hypothetical protein